MGAAKHPAFPAPSLFEGWNRQELGRDCAAGMRKHVPMVVVASEATAIQRLRRWRSGWLGRCASGNDAPIAGPV